MLLLVLQLKNLIMKVCLLMLLVFLMAEQVITIFAVAQNPQTPVNNESQWTLISYLGRVNYSLSDKYLFTLLAVLMVLQNLLKAINMDFFLQVHLHGVFPMKILCRTSNLFQI